MEQQCAQTGKQQRGGHIQTGDGGDKNRCAEHGEQVLQTQNEHFAFSQDFGIIDGFLVFLMIHNLFSFLYCIRNGEMAVKKQQETFCRLPAGSIAHFVTKCKQKLWKPQNTPFGI
jgi:hypothetical protein